MLLASALCCVLIPFVISENDEHPYVTTSLGTVKGHYQRSYDGKIFSAFDGIPYAKPPVGNLRFEEPVEIEPWTGIWEATEQHTCMQVGWDGIGSAGSEDCLYINVFVPGKKPKPNENLDVVVNFHGGGFMVGTPKMAGPIFLMDRNIIYVNLNYRLGVLGFLSTEDSVVPGNNGLKDQTLALKWIKKHIRSFGGNPDSVTIIGLSAGGASVHFHYFSPLSKGLFHRGISQSGTALAPWAIQEKPLDMAKKLGESIGCRTSTTKELVACLKQRPAGSFIKNSYSLSPYLRFPLAPFSPVVERRTQNAFLSHHPYNLLKKGKINDVPWITSATTEEGILGIFMLADKLENIDNDWNKMLPYFLDYNQTTTVSQQTDISRKIKDFYFNDEKILPDNIRKLIKLFGDRYFYLDIEKSARMHAQQGNSIVYSYMYGYKLENEKANLLGPKEYYGVGHGEDGFLLCDMEVFGNSMTKEEFTEDDKLIKNLLVDIVTSFARNGKPEIKNIDWQPVTSADNFKYLFIHNDEIKMKTEKELAPTKFWNSLGIAENENIPTNKDEL